jgi:hypothetical protein
MCFGMGSLRSMASGRNEVMRARVRKTSAEQSLQARCDTWNAAHPVGTLVYFKRELGTAYTLTPAFMTAFGAVALLFLEGRERPVHLEAITAVKEESCTH